MLLWSTCRLLKAIYSFSGLGLRSNGFVNCGTSNPVSGREANTGKTNGRFEIRREWLPRKRALCNRSLGDNCFELMHNAHLYYTYSMPGDCFISFLIYI